MLHNSIYVQTYTVTCSVKYWILNSLQVKVPMWSSRIFVKTSTTFMHMYMCKNICISTKNKLPCLDLEYIEGKENEKEIELLIHVHFYRYVTNIMTLLKCTYLYFWNYLSNCTRRIQQRRIGNQRASRLVLPSQSLLVLIVKSLAWKILDAQVVWKVR